MSFSLTTRMIAAGILTSSHLVPLVWAVDVAHAETTIDRTRNVLREWVKIESLISEERNSWWEKKAATEDLIAIYGKELALLHENTRGATAKMTEADEKRSEWLRELEILQGAAEQIQDKLRHYEQQVLELLSYFPEPLRKDIQPFVQPLPHTPDGTAPSLTVRMQNLLEIFARVDRFNNVVTLDHETRRLPDGRRVEAKTLYFGLAAAFFVDAQGRIAGIGRPAPDDWEWKVEPSLAKAIHRMMAVFEGRSRPRWVPLPMSLHGAPDQHAK